MSPKITIQKNISDYFDSLPLNGKALLIQKLNSQVPELLTSYANQLNLSPIDFVANLQINRQLQQSVQNIAKSESIYSLIVDSTNESNSQLYNTIRELSYKSYFTNESLSKSLKNAAIGLGMAAMFANPNMTEPPKSDAIPHSIHSSFKAKPWGSQPEDRFLHNTMQLESSGGTNTNHEPITWGKYKNQTAMGRWGLLPSTVREVFNRKKGMSHPDVERIGSMNNDQLTSYLKDNPEIELHLARHLARHVMNKQHGDPLKSAYAWKFGHNLSPESIGPQELGNKYVQDYQNLQNGNKLRGLRPASFGKSEQFDFSSRLNKWVKDRADQQQDQVSRTMKQYEDLIEIPDHRPSENRPPVDQNLDLEKPMDRMKLAVRKVVGQDGVADKMRTK